MAMSPKVAVTEAMSEEELAALAQEGREEALVLLVERCVPLVKRQAALLRGSVLESEDLAQEGMMGLLSAVRTYRPGAARFGTYASVCIRNRMLSAVRRAGLSFGIPFSGLSNEEALTEFCREEGQADDPAQLLVRREEEFRLHGRLKQRLSSREYAVLMLYLQSYSYEESALRLGIPPKAVDNALQRARRKLSSSVFWKTFVSEGDQP